MKKKRTTRRDIILAGNGGNSDECWEWPYGKTPDGYGSVWVNGRSDRTHRVSYEAHTGPIPDGMEIDHACHTRSCWNPAHLRAVTRAQNTQHRQLHPTNTSGYRGVYFSRQSNKWRAQVKQHNRTIHLGYFETAEEAAEVAKAKRRELGYLGR